MTPLAQASVLAKCPQVVPSFGKRVRTSHDAIPGTPTIPASLTPMPVNERALEGV